MPPRVLRAIRLNVSSYIKVTPHAFKCREGKIKEKLTRGARGSSVQRQITDES